MDFAAFRSAAYPSTRFLPISNNKNMTQEAVCHEASGDFALSPNFSALSRSDVRAELVCDPSPTYHPYQWLHGHQKLFSLRPNLV